MNTNRTMYPKVTYPELIHKSVPATLTLPNDAEGVFEGYASLWNKPDTNGDEVTKGAFQRAIERRGVGGIRMLFQHDPNSPIGVWEDIREDERGLHVRGRLTKGVRKSAEVLSLLKSGALDGLSIGYRPVKTSRNQLTSNRVLRDIDLWEISVVTFPMLTQARIYDVKGTSNARTHHATQTIAATLLLAAAQYQMRSKSL